MFGGNKMADFSQFKKVRPVSVDEIIPKLDYSYISKQFEESQKESFKAMQDAVEERERNEQEKRESLRRIADNSQDTVNALKETNELLKQNNELLKRENESLSQRLDEMSKILGGLFELEEENSDEQKELLRQAVALAIQIDMSITENGKFDWKNALTNTTTTGLFMGLQVYLHNKGLL